MDQEMQRFPDGDASGVFVLPPHVVEQIRAQPECRVCEVAWCSLEMTT
jgi:hypothetical protein